MYGYVTRQLTAKLRNIGRSYNHIHMLNAQAFLFRNYDLGFCLVHFEFAITTLNKDSILTV